MQALSLISVTVTSTVGPALKDHPIGPKIWSLKTGGSITLKCRTFCQEHVVLQDRWSLKMVVS